LKKKLENHGELIRYATSKNVRGGARKLFKYFIKNYRPEQILSYCDKRWGTGSLYEQLGFIQQQDTGVGYFYVKGYDRIYRYALRKNENDDPNLTEYENRLNQGYKRIWDCGNTKWIWINQIPPSIITSELKIA
jgi:hypothetical protein